MEEITVEDIGDYLKKTIRYDNRLFRGVSSKDYKLTPSVGRTQPHWTGKHGAAEERAALEAFKNKSWPFVDKQLSDIEWLAMGQHHGLWTRLLDWTKSPLVALYFAVMNMGCGGKEGAVYIVKPPERLPVDQDFDIFSYKETYYFEAPVVSPRIAAQSGVFTLHHDPQSAWEPACTVKIILPYGVCGKLKEDLQKLGVSESSLFPDIDGQAHGVNWLFKWGKL